MTERKFPISTRKYLEELDEEIYEKFTAIIHTAERDFSDWYAVQVRQPYNFDYGVYSECFTEELTAEHIKSISQIWYSRTYDKVYTPSLSAFELATTAIHAYRLVSPETYGRYNLNRHSNRIMHKDQLEKLLGQPIEKIKLQADFPNIKTADLRVIVENYWGGQGVFGDITNFIRNFGYNRETGYNEVENLFSSYNIGTMCGNLYQPEVNKDDKSKVDFYRNAQDMERDRRTTIKIGRFFKYVLPKDVPATTVENMVREWVANSVDPEYKLIVGKSEEDFVDAYSLPRSRNRDPSLREPFKSLSYSCMHIGSDHNDFCRSDHPVRSYASGDFEVAYVVDAEGKIGGRVVICTSTGYYGPIYIQDSFAGRVLKDYCVESGYKDAESVSGAWDGARLLVWDKNPATVCKDSDFRIPYMDVGGNVSVCADGTMYVGHMNTGGELKECLGLLDASSLDLYQHLEVCCRNGCAATVYFEVCSADWSETGTCYDCGEHVMCGDTGNIIPREDAFQCTNSYQFFEHEDAGGTCIILDHWYSEYYLIKLLDGSFLRKTALSEYIEDYGYEQLPAEYRPDEDENEEAAA